MRKTIIPIVLSIFILAACGNGPGVGIGESAPDFTLKNYGGNEISLHDFKGKVVMVNFWAGWCPFCIAEMPAMAVVHEEFKDSGFTVLAINRGQTLENAKKFTDSLNISDVYPLLLDTEDALFPLYQSPAMPATYFIDQEGIVRDVYFGAIDSKGMRAKIQPLLDR